MLPQHDGSGNVKGQASQMELKQRSDEINGNKSRFFDKKPETSYQHDLNIRRFLSVRSYLVFLCSVFIFFNTGKRPKQYWNT